jgi:hypothetical protein
MFIDGGHLRCDWPHRRGEGRRTAESKSARSFNDFNPRLKKTEKITLSNFNSLAVFSKMLGSTGSGSVCDSSALPAFRVAI